LTKTRLPRGVMGPRISLPSSVIAPVANAADRAVVLALVRGRVEGIHALAMEAAERSNSDNFIVQLDMVLCFAWI
jgi:hypothetical protein